MASKYDAKTTAIEAHESHLGESYRKNGEDAGMEMSDELPVSRDGALNRNEVLEHAISNLENKKTTWYAYFTTLDFWSVLALG